MNDVRVWHDSAIRGAAPSQPQVGTEKRLRSNQETEEDKRRPWATPSDLTQLCQQPRVMPSSPTAFDAPRPC
jgi:hypothetical protein